MQEIMVRLPGNRIHKIKLKNNELQQEILDVIDAAILKWVSFSENRKWNMESTRKWRTTLGCNLHETNARC